MTGIDRSCHPDNWRNFQNKYMDFYQSNLLGTQWNCLLEAMLIVTKKLAYTKKKHSKLLLTNTFSHILSWPKFGRHGWAVIVIDKIILTNKKNQFFNKNHWSLVQHWEKGPYGLYVLKFPALSLGEQSNPRLDITPGLHCLLALLAFLFLKF